MICQCCMPWANLPSILKECLVLHGKFLYIDTFLLIDHFYISLPLFPLLLLRVANMLIQDSSQGSCLLDQTNGRGRTEKLSFLILTLSSHTHNIYIYIYTHIYAYKLHLVLLTLEFMLSFNKFALNNLLKQLPALLPTFNLKWRQEKYYHSIIHLS